MNLRPLYRLYSEPLAQNVKKKGRKEGRRRERGREERKGQRKRGGGDGDKEMKRKRC